MMEVAILGVTVPEEVSGSRTYCKADEGVKLLKPQKTGLIRIVFQMEN